LPGVVIYGVGSPLVADVEESLGRAGTPVAAAVQNQPGSAHLLDPSPLIAADDLTPALLDLPYLVPLFRPANRQHAADEAAARGLSSPYVLIDPSVAVPRSLDAAPGLYVNAGCSLGAASRYEEWVLVNRGAGVGHHVHLGRFVSIGPGAVLAGQVMLGDGALVGAGAVVLPGRTIGANAVIGAGSVVTDDVPDGCLVVGNPARVVNSDMGGFRDRPVV
jgi:sugar O-acyltransferase (sialic acid O-acetyltransferase NeuD family)